MAIDQNPPTLMPDPPTQAAIENEIPAYRAISPGAVISLVLGLVSVFCFTDLWFLLVVGAAIVAGLLSLRKIRKFPEVLTGALYARAGIALSLLFGLSAVTHLVASDLLSTIDASRFARNYVEVIKSQPVNVSLWYGQPPDYRKNRKPDEIADEIKKTKSPLTSDYYQERTGAVAKIKERLKGQGQEIHFSKIESKVIDGLTLYANALVEIDGPSSKDFPDKEEFALLEMVKGPNMPPSDWVVKEVRYPYTPASVRATVSKKDDGHGHSH